MCETPIRDAIVNVITERRYAIRGFERGLGGSKSGFDCCPAARFYLYLLVPSCTKPRNHPPLGTPPAERLNVAVGSLSGCKPCSKAADRRQVGKVILITEF
jgi:hypothetical protein